MGRATRVETLNLQTFAMDLKAKGLSDAKIAAALAKRSGQPVTRDAVNSFFRKKNAAKVEVVEKSDKLKKKLVEAELNTVQGCLDCIDTLKEICTDARRDGDTRAAILAIAEIYKGLDMLNKVLGKYQNLPTPNVNFFVSTPNTPQVKEAAGRLCELIREAQDAEFTETED